MEFQEDKKQFSIYRLLRYVTDLMEAYPDALIVPTVLFTKRERWRKDVKQELNSQWASRQFLHFEYVLIKLFDYQARDYYDHPNPVVKILLPKMNYKAADRTEVIMQAYRGLYDLVAPMLFYKYLDFIDVYANVREDERDAIFHEMTEQEDTAMLAQYIKDMGFKEGELKGKLEGKLEGGRMFLERLLTRRFGPLPEWGRDQLANATLEQLDRWAERALDADSIQAVLAE